MNKEIEVIAHFHSDFPSKFGIPRQSGLVPQLQGSIVFTPKYRQAEALRGLEDFSHLWLIWEFSANKHQASWQSTVRPPRLGGNRSMGVFATRSPYRPNAMGLSCVEIASIDLNAAQGPVIHVLGADLLDGTPIYDIKPYVAYADSIPHARCGFVDSTEKKCLEVNDDKHLLTSAMPADKAEALIAVLQQDPRPSYQDDPHRIYGLSFASYDVKFRVENDCAYILEINNL